MAALAAKRFAGFLVLAGMALALAGSPQRARAEDLSKEERKAQEKRQKEKEKAEKEAQKAREKEEKEAQKKLPPKPPPPPALTERNGEAIHDAVVAFEVALASADEKFLVLDTVKHDYEACGKTARALDAATAALVRIHEDRVRQFGTEFHHDLELMAENASRLNSAVAEHQRVNIFTYYNQLMLIRNKLALNAPWKE